MPTIRKATPNDALRLSHIAERTFRDTFASANNAANMDLHCTSSYSEAMQASEISSPDRCTLLCEDERALLGYAQLRWNASPECVSGASPGEIQRLYVVSDWQGKGIAQELMKSCLEELRARGSDVVWLGVWERNPRAQSFYKKCGFVEVGAHTFLLGDDPQRDVIMARSVPG